MSPSLLRGRLFLCGPTASGKSAVALEIARRLAGFAAGGTQTAGGTGFGDPRPVEILALDSMTVYRGLTIGTAKPTADEQAVCRHHLLDLVEPEESFSVADYLAAADAAAAGIAERDRWPLFVGGAGMYLRSMLRGLDERLPSDPAIRRRLEDRGAAEGSEVLHAELAAIDPAAAGKIHGNDLRRVVRALEVHEITGRPISAGWTKTEPLPEGRRPRMCVWLSWPREQLRRRIDERVDAMFAAGWLAEAATVWRRLRDAGGSSAEAGQASRTGRVGQTARQALGYATLFDWFDDDPARAETHALRPPAEVVRVIQAKTRQFAKRQETWFRGLPECEAVPVSAADSPTDVAERLPLPIR